MNGTFMNKEDFQIFLDLATIQLRLAKAIKEMKALGEVEGEDDQTGFFLSSDHMEKLETALTEFNTRKARYLILKDEVKEQMNRSEGEEMLDSIFSGAVEQADTAGDPAPPAVSDQCSVSYGSTQIQDPFGEWSQLDNIALGIWESMKPKTLDVKEYDRIAVKAYERAFSFMKAKLAFSKLDPSDEISVEIDVEGGKPEEAPQGTEVPPQEGDQAKVE